LKLRHGRTKSILHSAVDSALIAVEIYNKPRAPFRTQSYVSLMIIAWTKLFHAYFNREIGEKYFHKKKGSTRYEIIDGERKAWELRTCIKQYPNLTDAVKTNLDLFIRLRNKIEHRHVEKHELDALLFGECQSFLFNFETLLVRLFGEEYAISENLAYSLQFSTLRATEQEVAQKKLASSGMADIKKFVETYRSQLSQEVFDSSEFSIKLIQIPKIANASRNDLAIEFVNWNSLNEEDQKAYEKLGALVKDKIVKQSVTNLGGMKPSVVLKKVEESCQVKLTHNDHKCLLSIFSVKPDKNSNKDPSDTIDKYCTYDDVHGDYVYYEAWVECLCSLLKADKMKKFMWTQSFKGKRRYELEGYIE